MSDPSRVSKLKAISRVEGIPEDEIDLHFDELLKGESDRAAALVGATLLEKRLAGLIKAHMKIKSQTDFDSVFREEGPLRTFSSKILIAYSFSIIQITMKRNLIYIKEIRNAFAHAVRPITFNTKEVSDVVELLAVSSAGASFLDGGKAAKNYSRTKFVFTLSEIASSLTEMWTIKTRQNALAEALLSSPEKHHKL